MPRTLEDVQKDLSTVNAALQDLIAGKRITQLRLGSGDFTRWYSYQECTYEILKAEQLELSQELDLVSVKPGLTFRTMTNIPLTVTKFRS